MGQEVVFVKEATTNSNIDRGTLYLGKDVATGENINEALVAAGLVEVRRLNKPKWFELIQYGEEDFVINKFHFFLVKTRLD